MSHHHEHHHHEHHHHGGKRQLTMIVLTILLLAGAIIIDHQLELPLWKQLLLYLVPYLTIGYPTLHEAVEGICHGDALNEHFLMTIATIGALTIGFLPGADDAFIEAVAVMLLFQIGEWAEGYAEGKSRDSISHLMNIRPDIAHRVIDNGQGQETLETVNPKEITVGETIAVKTGEKIPLDGIVISGHSSLNSVALTGESMPQDVSPGSEVLSGCVNLSGLLYVRVTKEFGKSTASKIIELVEHASENKSKSETFITRFARTYTPVVVIAAIALAFIPPLFSGNFMANFSIWLYRALLFLVVSCPCALVISVPLTFFGGIGGASRKGILVKGASYMDVLAKVKTVVFDKTGTLTQGHFSVECIHSSTDKANPCEQCHNDATQQDEATRLLHLAAHVEHFSTHPIAMALREAFPDEATDGCTVSDVQELAGKGVCALVDGKMVCVGNTKLMDSLGVNWKECSHEGTIVHVAIDGIYAGHIIINDTIKEKTYHAIGDLKKLNIEHIVMLTGDREEVARKVANLLDISQYHANLMPSDKLKYLEQLLSTKEDGESLAFVGDGINDAPVLTRADVGIAMGGLGSEAAIESADVVIMDDNPQKIALAIRLAQRTIGIAWQNVCFAIGVKVAFLLLAILGLCTMWMAVFADVGVTILAVLNAMRALKIRQESPN